MAISAEDFASAQPGQHAFVDAHGREWKILGVIPHGHLHVLEVQCPGHDREGIYCDGAQILEKAESAIIVELNHSKARRIDVS